MNIKASSVLVICQLISALCSGTLLVSAIRCSCPGFNSPLVLVLVLGVLVGFLGHIPLISSQKYDKKQNSFMPTAVRGPSYLPMLVVFPKLAW